MAATSPSFAGSSITNIVHRGRAGAGPFMLTLCRLTEPISIRPPQSAHLKPFTFFTSRARQRDGSDQVYLHMGFFDTLAHAQRWVRAVRGRHPDAIATLAPPTLWQDSADSRQFAPVNSQSLTDTQVLDILEMRRAVPAESEGDEQGNEQIELLRPDDTVTRLALKEAVVQGEPVSFAVQLHWSVRPIDLGNVPALAIFKAYSLYTVESRRTSRSCYFLRLGFFGDPISAKQVALHVRSSFASAAVVPVLDEEIADAREACMDVASVPCLVQQRLDEQAEPVRMPAPAAVSKTDAGRRRGAAAGSETLEQTLAQLAEREIWNDPDLLSDTGVRHLKVEIQGRSSNRRH
jgi:hypothetical protein